MAAIPSNSSTVIVDDADPSLIYNGTWISGGTTNELDGTTHGTTVGGASVKFTFHGTSVAVYGTNGIDTAMAAFTLDASAPLIYAAGKVKVPLYQQLFYKSSTLSDGQHTLVVTDISGELWIDYFLYMPSVSSSTSPLPPSTPPLSSSTSLSSTRTITSTSSKPVVVSHVSSTPPTSSATDLPQPNSDTPVGRSSVPAPVVAGAAIGVFILIIALIFGLLYYRKRAKRLAGINLLEKKDVLDDPPELDKPGTDAIITPFTSAYTSGPHPLSGNRGSINNLYPPGSAYPPLDHSYQDQSHPSTPIYHFSNNYALRSSYNAPPDHIAPPTADHGYGGMGHGDPQSGGAQRESTGRLSYLENPHSQHGGAQQQTNAPSDTLATPQRRGSIESAGSGTSLAYLSADRLATDPSSPLPDVLPAPPPAQAQATPYRTSKGGLIVHNNTELRQHEDGGVRLGVQVIDLPPVYKPNY